MRRAGAVSVSGAVLLALLCIALSLLVSGPVGAQTENGTLKFEEGTQATGQQAREDDPAGPLSGTEVTARSTDNDRFVERILIPRPGCELVRGETTSFVLEDENGTQADFIEDENIQIRETRDGLLVTSDPDNPGAMEPNNIVPLNERGGDDVLATGGLTVVTSTDIRCEDDAGGGGGDNEDNVDDGNNGDNGNNGDAGNNGDNGVAAAQDDGDLDCADFDSQAEAQAEFDADTSDPNDLDADDDDEACEQFDYGQLTNDNDDGGPTNGQYGNDGDVDDPDDVVPGTGADGDLPDTGGASLLFGAAALVLAAALLARRVLAP